MSKIVLLKDEDKIAVLDGFRAYRSGQLLKHVPLASGDVTIDVNLTEDASSDFAEGNLKFGCHSQMEYLGRYYSVGDDNRHGSIGHVICSDADGHIEWIITDDAGPYERVWWYCGDIWAQSPGKIYRISDWGSIRIRTLTL